MSSVSDSRLELVGPDGEPCVPEPGAWLLAPPKQTLAARVEVVDTEGLRADKVRHAATHHTHPHLFQQAAA